MARTIFIEYEIDGVASSAYSVVLASEDGTYGIKRRDTGEVIVSHGTSVVEDPTGHYEYSFSPLDGVVYLISWKIQAVNGGPYQYVVQSVGPFTSDSSLRTVTDYRGSFVQGTTTTLFFKLTEVLGDPVDPDSIEIEIYNEDGDSIVDGTPEKISVGAYIFDWAVAVDLPPGPYTAVWRYDVGSGQINVDQGVIVIADGDAGPTSLYAGRIAQFRHELELMICCAQAIPVRDEQGISNSRRDSYSFTFGRWNQSGPIRIYRNQKSLDEDLTVDYFRGKVIFDRPLTDYDTVNADYTFRWFEDEQLDRFLSNALHIVNFTTPQTAYGLPNVPDIYIPLILYGAAKDALRELLLCIQFQQPQKVFGGRDASQKAFGNIETLKKNYEGEFKELLEKKKYGRYPSIKAVVVPEFTLPGGRSRWFRYLFGGGS